jgi:protein-tyrosine phosphatase
MPDAMPDAMPHFPRQLLWPGCANTRHLGGFVSANGQITSDMSLVRSDNLTKLSTQGQEAVIADGVTTIIDLRFAEEIAKNPNPLATAARMNYRHCPMMSTADPAALDAVRAATTTQAAYWATLLGFGHNIAVIITAIAEAGAGRVVLHCSAGKDRTGLAIALALRLVGVSKDDIASDYALTDVYLQANYEEELAAITDPVARAAQREDLQTRPEYILDTLAALEAAYGSVEQYLMANGMTQATIERLRQRLLLPLQ